MPHATTNDTRTANGEQPPSTVHCPPSTVHRPPSTGEAPPTVRRPRSTAHCPPTSVPSPSTVLCPPSSDGPSIQVLDPLTTPSWDSALRGRPDATPFHTRGWAQTLSATYPHTPCYFAVVEAGSVQAILPLMQADSWLTGRKAVSLPFTDSCPPLASAEQLSALFQAALSLGRRSGWKYIELRGVPPGVLGMEPSLSFLGHALDLTAPEEEIFRRFHSSVRRAIRKAETAAVAVALGSGFEDVRAYYRLHCRTRQRHGLPPQPFRFFENLQQHVLQPGHGFVAIARHQGRPVAAAVFLHFGQNAIYKYGASDFRFQELRANDLVMWRAIQACRRLGCQTLHFGRTSAENQGLRRFKLGFGCREDTLNYLRFDPHRQVPVPMRDRSESPMNRLFGYVPRPLARCLGAALYPHIT